MCNIYERWVPVADTWYHIAVVDGWVENLVRESGFTSDASWNKGTGWTIAGGVASCSGAQSAPSSLDQQFLLTLTEEYITQFTITSYTAGSIALIAGDGTGAGLGTSRVGVGTYTETLTSTGDRALALLADAGQRLGKAITTKKIRPPIRTMQASEGFYMYERLSL